MTNVIVFPTTNLLPSHAQEEMELFDLNEYVTGGKEGFVAYPDDDEGFKIIDAETGNIEWLLVRVNPG